MLIEIARQKGDYLPEVSFGSHFFQDLVESKIRYLALYPDEQDIVFNDEFLRGRQNSLTELLPEAGAFEEVVRVIHVPEASAGALLNIDMDGDSQQAMAWLPPA